MQTNSQALTTYLVIYCRSHQDISEQIAKDNTGDDAIANLEALASTSYPSNSLNAKYPQSVSSSINELTLLFLVSSGDSPNRIKEK